MAVIIFDIETNDIKNFNTLLGLKTIHCIALATPDEDPKLVPVDEALKILSEADVIVGHNIQDFDLRAIKRLHPDWEFKGEVLDTLILSRVLWPDIIQDDYSIIDFPRNLMGRHSLKSWGYRLGILKGEFSDTNDFSEYTEEMGEYCVQDVKVTKALWEKIQKENLPENPSKREHEFSAIIKQQELDGIAFDVEKARTFHAELLGLKNELYEELVDNIPPKIVPMKTCEYFLDPETGNKYKLKGDAPDAKTKSRLKDGPLRKKVTNFNPASRLQIANFFIEKYGWEPEDYTGEGRPKVDESVLGKLDYPEAKLLSKYLTIIKRLGMLSDGAEAWLKLEVDGRIHGQVNPCGAVTTRCTHRRPNMSQVPRVNALYGKTCRELFYAPEGFCMVGADMSGLELRALAHYTFPHDNGKYRDAILNGDIHSANQEAADLPDRNMAKVLIYALCYGAGNQKLGAIVGGGMSEGAELRERFLRNMPALKRVQDGVKAALDHRDYLKAVDGRRLKIRSKHSALNTLLQSCGSIAMKEATCLMHRKFREHGYSKEDVIMVAHVHDEVQLQVRKELADNVGRITVQSMRDAGENLSLNCPLDGEYKVGRNWAETH